MNKQNRNRLIDTENVLTVASGRGIGGMDEKVEGLRNTNWSPGQVAKLVRALSPYAKVGI